MTVTAPARGRPRSKVPTEEELKRIHWERRERASRINDAIRRGGWPSKKAFLAEHDLTYSSLHHWQMRGDPSHGPPQEGQRQITQEFLAGILRVPFAALSPGGPRIYEQAI